MVEVGGSNPPGPTKTQKSLAIAGLFGFRGIGLGENRVVRQNATTGAFWSPERSDGAPKG